MADQAGSPAAGARSRAPVRNWRAPAESGTARDAASCGLQVTAPPLRATADTAFAATAPTHQETRAHIGGNEKMAEAYPARPKSQGP